MPIIKNGFSKAAMNKDFDERIVPSGQYRDAMNIQVSTSEGSSVGTVQNILGNKRVESLIPADPVNLLIGQEFKCVGAVADEKNDVLYWFVTCVDFDAIIEYKDDPTNQTANTCTPILVDRNKDVLKFDYNNLITAVNIIDDLLFWTDNVNEPRKINITTLKNNNHTTLSTHSNMYVRSDWGQAASTMVSIGEIREDHITVVRKKPGRAPTVAFSESNIQRVYSFGDQPASAFNLLPIDISISGSLPLAGTDTLTFCHEGYSDYFQDFEYKVGDTILLSREDTIGNLPQNYELKLKITSIQVDVWNSGAGWGRFKFTASGVDLLEVKNSIPVNESFFYNSYKKVDTDILFETEFIRFATRYKYADGEYSAFSPFTQPVFLSGSYGFHPTKDPYNLGMTNNIIHIKLQDLITPDIPNDVTQIDILFKKENSPTIYSVDSIKPDDPVPSGGTLNSWNENNYTNHTYLKTDYIEGGITNNFHGTTTTSNKGEYIVSTENIYAAVPANQILRPWDNVPRQALAQEITANRIVYANYLQNYNLRDFQDRPCYPDLALGYEERSFDNNAITFKTGKQSIKSNRTYYLGMVYGDRYGRETPIFTGKDSSIKIPYDISDDPLVFAGAGSKSLRLKGNLIGDQPSFAEYYKYFIKQTTGEYYNLTMDRVYKNVGDDTMWISFPSSDRNKLQEGDYLTVKKQVDIEQQVPEENKIKVIDIKSEAPHSIKFEYTQLGTGGGSAADLAALFSNSSSQPAEDVARISIDRETWIESEFGMDLDNFASTSRHLVIQFEITSSNIVTKSEKYDVAAYFREEAGNDGVYNFLLNKRITAADNWVESSPGVLNSAKNLTIIIFEKLEKNATEFEGRFFVKIISNALTNKYLIPSTSDLTDDFQVVARAYAFHLHDRHQTTSSVNAATNGLGLYNNEIFSAGTTNTAIGGVDTRTEPRWAEITKFNTNETSNQGWFFDNMYFTSGQEPPGMQATLMWDAAQSGRMNKGNNTIPNQVIHGMEAIVKANPIGTGYNFSGTAPNGPRHWSDDKVIRLKNDLSGYISSGSGGADVTWTSVYDADTANTENVYMHFSYSSVGVDLHDGDFTDFDNNVEDDEFDNSLQWIASKSIHHDDGSGNTHNHSIGNNITEFNLYMNATSLEAHDRQFDPSYRGGPAAEAVMNRLVAGSRFHFDGDTSNTTYTILSSEVKYLYNHTPWNPVYETGTGASGTPALTGQSVSEALQAWGNAGYTTGAAYEKLKGKIVDFGRANNRRTLFILQLGIDGGGNSDPRDSSYDPLDPANSSFNDYQTIRFVENYIEPGENTLPVSPAIFETEGKEDVDLNIYYEASDALPIRLDITDGNGPTGLESNELLASGGVRYEKDSIKGYLLAPVGSRVTVNNPGGGEGEIDYDPQAQQFPEEDFFVRVADWDANILSIEGPGFQAVGTGSTALIDSSAYYSGKELTFWKDDLSYTKGLIYAVREIVNNSDGSAAYVTKIEVHPMVYQVEVGLPYYNCFSFGNGVESNRIRDDYNESFILNGVKASTVLEEPYEEERRKYGLIYSGLYNSTSGVNNLNQFIQAEKITKDVMPSYGSIQKLYARDNDLIAFCEDKVLQIFVDKDVLYNADGRSQLLATNRVLGEARPFSGDYGISRNPESFAKESFRAYFTDKQRGAVLRLSKDGLTPISDQGMHDYFRDNLRDGGKIYGSYDLHKKDYNLSIFYADGQNLITNPGFEESGDFQWGLGNELLLNPGFDNPTATYTPNAVVNQNMQGSGGSVAPFPSNWERHSESVLGDQVATSTLNSANSPSGNSILFSSPRVASQVYVPDWGPGPHPDYCQGLVDFPMIAAPGGGSGLMGPSEPHAGQEVEISFDIFNLTHDIDGGARRLRIFYFNSGGDYCFSDWTDQIQQDANTQTITKTLYLSSMPFGGYPGPTDKHNKVGFEIGSHAVDPQVGNTIWSGVSFNIDNVIVRNPNWSTPKWNLQSANTYFIGPNAGDYAVEGVPTSQTPGTRGDSGVPITTGWHRLTADIHSVVTPGTLKVSVDSATTYINTLAPGPGLQNSPWGNWISTPGLYSNDIYISDDGFAQKFQVGMEDATGYFYGFWPYGQFKINAISFKEILPGGGGVPPWDMDPVGLAATPGQIFYNQFGPSGKKVVTFRDAIPGVYLAQPLPDNPSPTLENAEFHFLEGDKYRVTFKMSNVDLGGLTPQMTVLVYNTVNEGFEEVIDLASTINPLTGKKNYEFIHEIGESVTTLSYLTNRISFYIGTWDGAAWVGDDLVFGNIDDVSIEKIGGGKTITFSEDVKGWSSFKSFVPEFGISVVNQYYTMKHGKLYKHHIPGTDRNTFYGEFEESSVTPILNKQPDIIKNFNTLFYEGSQSKIDFWELWNPNDGEYYNLQDEDGWYVHDIHTDKQKGSLNEFIEKEGKWFNYIKGRSSQIDPSAFNFQGIGTVEGVENIGCQDPAALNYDPNATIDGNCVYAADVFTITVMDFPGDNQ